MFLLGSSVMPVMAATPTEGHYTVDVSTPGTLEDKVDALEADIILGLTVTGSINSADIAYLVESKFLTYIDISDVKLVPSEEPYRLRSRTSAQFQGSTINSYYVYSDRNEDVQLPGTFRVENYKCYRNDLSYAFAYDTNLEELHLPKSLANVGESICYGQTNLKSVTLPNAPVNIGKYAFYNCKGLSEAMILPSSLERIDFSAFSFCKNDIKAPSLPNLKTIGGYAFENSGLSQFDCGEKLDSIGERAFVGCKLSGTVKLPDNVVIGAYAFLDCSGINKVITGKGVKVPSFSGCKNIEEVEIGDNSTIAQDAFRRIPALKKVTVGANVHVGPGAFEDCSNLADVSVSPLLSDIETGGFNNTPFFAALTAVDGIKYVGNVAYALESTDTNLGKELKFRPGTTGVSQIFCNNGGWFKYTGDVFEKITLPEGLITLSKECFNESSSRDAFEKVTEITLPASLRKIGESAFSNGFMGLTSLNIPEQLVEFGSQQDGLSNVTRLYYNAANAEAATFKSWPKLAQVIFGEKVRTIPSKCFSDVKTLQGVKLPEGLEEIGEEAFRNCTALRSIALPSSVTSMGKLVFAGCTALKTADLSDNIEIIPEGSFRECDKLKNVHWPLHLKGIEPYAFYMCSALTAIYLPEGFEEVKFCAFYQTTSIRTIYIPSTYNFKESKFTLGITDNVQVTVNSTEVDECCFNDDRKYYTLKVPAEAVARYKADENWGTFGTILPIEEISTSEEETVTAFDSGITEDTDLTDTVIGDLYLTLGEGDGYDPSDSSIVLATTMTAEETEAIGGMAPGRSDLAGRFNGIVVMVQAGKGVVTVNCVTLGTNNVSVKVGESAPETYAQNSRGDIMVAYDVAEPTYIYIYGAKAEEPGQSPAAVRGVTAASNCVKLYSVGVNPEPAGIDNVVIDNNAASQIIEYYNLNGVRIAEPSGSGVYIGRRADGSVSKIQIK